ncbi:MAG: hypothetical protein [Circular genetic element sp.]|nr:MAG: hypothetical protein [Circular genetic element sp.]
MKTMTIRGDIEVPETGTSLNHLIFNYQSPDRTRAWKVVRARTWVVDWDSNTSSADKAGMMSAVLASDTIPVNWGYSSSAADNRVFAWNQQQILVRGTTDILIPQAGLFQQADFIIDSDRIITNQLYINYANRLEGATGNTVVAYLIELEELKITEDRAIILQLKGIGQDIDA